MMTDLSPDFYDYQDSMQKLFNNFDIKTALEFGLGEGTKFLLNNVRELTSVELQVYDVYAGWFDKIAHDLKDTPNWKGILYQMPNEYTDEIKKTVEEIISRGFDMVFVDPATTTRPLIVNSCIDLGVRFIVAHDTNAVYDDYSWDKVDPDNKYHSIKVENAKGTTYYFREIDDFTKFRKVMEGA